MERPIIKPIGTPVEELDTPALVVDLAQFELNVETVHSFFARKASSIRPFVGTHRCPALAHVQLSVAGHAGGVAVGTVGQAAVFVDAGVSDVMITGKAVTALKIASLCALAKRAQISIAVDNADNIQEISMTSSAAGATVDLLVEIDGGLGLTGVESSKQVVELAKRISEAPGVRFAGITSYGGPNLNSKKNDAEVNSALAARNALEATGFNVHTVALGSTGDYETVGSIDGVTEVVAGTYALIDARYGGQNSPLQPAAKVLGTIVSTPVDGLAVGDAGMKTNGNDTGLPNVAGVDGAEVVYLSAEHFNIDLTHAASELSVGEKVWFVPYDIAVTANNFDYIMAARDGQLAAILSVTARGIYR